jgi:membrane protease YdiL (CAAX protease family)
VSGAAFLLHLVLLLLLLLLILALLWQEFFFRGFVLPSLTKWVNPPLAVRTRVLKSRLRVAKLPPG